MSDVNVSVLKGLTLTAVNYNGSDEIEFVSQCGRKFNMYHGQDCCESVTVNDITGDLADLVGSEILEAEEVSSEGTPPPKGEYVDSFTWTFYRFGTRKGSVTLRWLGESNGYYSESVDFEELT